MNAVFKENISFKCMQDRVYFLPNILYGIMFLICAGNSVHGTGTIFFSAHHTTPPARRLGVHKKLRGDTVGRADLI